MSRIVIAAPSEDSRSRVSRLLLSSGFQVFRVCATGSELRRALSESEDCVVVMIGSLQDCKPDELLWDYHDRIQILVIAKPVVLEQVESPEIFRLSLPVSGQAVIGAVEMLSQLHRRALPHRTGKEKELVEQAKTVLMRRMHITEPEAHHYLQKQAMDHGIKMTEYAERILRQSQSHSAAFSGTDDPGR